MQFHNLVSLGGVLLIPFCAWLFSEQKRRINIALICFTIIIELLFVFFIFKYPAGTKIFAFLNQSVIALLNASAAGSRFLFGRLALPPGEEGTLGFYLAFQAFPTIIFFSALVSILYLYRILPFFINFFARIFSRLLKISGAESLSGCSGFFFGVESLLTVKPYLSNMTRSEINTLLTCGMATVSSNVLGLYVFSLKDVFPNIAAHIISASFLSVPAALLISKLLVPETEEPVTMNQHVKMTVEKKTLFEAISEGAMEGVKLIVGISALLIAVLGLVELADMIISFIMQKGASFLGFDCNLNITSLLAYLFYPFTLMIGICSEDLAKAAEIIGERIIITEVGAYHHLKEMMAENIFHDKRTPVIISYVLCGFTHTASLAIFTGALSQIIPERAALIARLAFKSFFGAILATLMTGAVAGVFLTSSNSFLGS